MEQHGLPGRRKEGNGNPSPRNRRGQLRNRVLARFFGSPVALVLVHLHLRQAPLLPTQMEQHDLFGRRKEGNGNPSPRSRRGQLRNGVLARFFGSPAALVRACRGNRGAATKNARVERLPPGRKGPPPPPTPEESPTRKKVRGDAIHPWVSSGSAL